MRLFVSIDLSESVRESIRLIQADLRDVPGLTLTNPDQAHITLKFLGETAESQLADLRAALSTAVRIADQPPFDVTFGGFGAFPSPEYIRVIWLGVVSDAEPLRLLHESIEEETIALGYDPEDHDFTPHVTLARMHHAGGKDAVQDFISQSPTPIESMRVASVRLKESTMTGNGTVYETIDEFSLDA